MTTKKQKLFSAVLGVLFMTGAAHASEQSMVPIVGGSSVSASDTIAKRTVALFFWETDGKNGLCSGSILDSSHILTAAHCVANYKQGLVVFSTTNIIPLVKKAATSGLAAAPQVRLMTSAVAQPGYSGQTGGNDEFNDLAIITFQGGLVAGYEPAHFLASASVFSDFASKLAITLSGYGITTAPNPQATGNQGSGTLRKVQVQFSSLSPKKIDVFVAGLMGHDACSGDSGGPAMISTGGDTYVIGVASRSDCRSTSIYTVVTQEAIQGILGTRFSAK